MIMKKLKSHPSNAQGPSVGALGMVRGADDIMASNAPIYLRVLHKAAGHLPAVLSRRYPVGPWLGQSTGRYE